MLRNRKTPYDPRRYIEAHDNERWRELSANFANWISQHTKLQNFGFSEGDTVEIGTAGKNFFCFEFPEQWHDHIPLFHQWAASINRLHGYVEAGHVIVVGHPEFRTELPQASGTVAVPPWLERT